MSNKVVFMLRLSKYLKELLLSVLYVGSTTALAVHDLSLDIDLPDWMSVPTSQVFFYHQPLLAGSGKDQIFEFSAMNSPSNCPKINPAFHILLTSPCGAVASVNREIISGQIQSKKTICGIGGGEPPKRPILGLERECGSSSKPPCSENLMALIIRLLEQINSGNLQVQDCVIDLLNSLSSLISSGQTHTLLYQQYRRLFIALIHENREIFLLVSRWLNT